MEAISLPKKKADLATAIDQIRAAAWSQRNAYLAQCQIAYYYLRGYRRFQVTNLNEGKVLIGYETDLGELRFRNEDLRSKYKTELGRLLRMDLRPSTRKRESGLDALRKASMGQVTLDYSIRNANLKTIQSDFTQQLLTFGTVGLAHWKSRGPMGKLEAEIEVIPPWELLPVPAYPKTMGDVRGLMRYRKVPLEWLRKKAVKQGEEGLHIPASNYETLLKVEKIPYGAAPDTTGASGAASYAESFNTEIYEKSGPAVEEEWVPLEETWICGPDQTVSRWVVKIGDHIGLDVDFEEKKQVVPMPIAIARAVPDMSFYSYGWVMMMISGNHADELMLQNLYRNVQELDQYGTVMWPATAGAGRSEFGRKNGRPKLVTFEPDYSAPQVQPFNIQPSNTGDFPGRVVQMSSQRQDKIAGQGPMMSGQPVGRMDSGAGYGFVFEVSQIAVAAIAHQIADAWTQVYRSILETANIHLTAEDTLFMSDVSNNLAGLVVSETGEITLASNAIPHYYEVEIDVRERQPTSTEKERQDAIGMLQAGILDPMEFRLVNYKKNLGFPMENRTEFEGYRKACFNNIRLFNDGKTPGEFTFSPIYDNPKMHLLAMDDFTARLEFAFASQQVRAAFEKHKQMLRELLGQMPVGMPMPGGMGPGGPQGPPGGPMGPGGPPGGPGGMGGPGGAPRPSGGGPTMGRPAAGGQAGPPPTS